jgi:hypothetical protein
MYKYILALACFLTVNAAFGIILSKAPIEGGVAGEPPPSDGTYCFYYYGTPAWQWTFPSGGYTAVNFDPVDNEGDTTSNPYFVTYVDSLWNMEPDGSYQVTIYICSDDGGLPDFDNPLYESDPYEPAYYSEWDEHEVSPPVQFNSGQICWVVFDVSYPDCHPISDGDGNSGHSWLSTDGYDWELVTDYGGADWCIEVYAEPGEPPDDTEEPYITDRYPLDEDWPCGVPPTEDTAGCHWQDGDAAYNVGVDVGTLTFEVRDSNGTIQAGELDVDGSDLFDVIVVFDVQGLWEENENFTVETGCYDLAGNSATDTWNFTTGYAKVEEKSFGAVKAGFAE